MQKVILKKNTLIIIVVVILGLLIGTILWHHHEVVKQEQSSLTIVLATHFGDANTSLGGMLAQQAHPAIVATFFSSTDQHSITNNAQALGDFHTSIKNYSYTSVASSSQSQTDIETSLSQDIQALIASYQKKDVTINVYGPAYFGPTITNTDNLVLHKAYIDVLKGYPQKNVQFFIYEDYPYVETFNKKIVTSLMTYNENETDLFLDRQNINLSQQDVSRKIASLKKYPISNDIVVGDQKYTNTRCGGMPQVPCEVVYKISP